MNKILTYIILLIFMLGLDYIWLTVIAGDILTQGFAHIGNFAEDGSFIVNYFAVIFVYIIMAIAIMVYILPKVKNYKQSFLYGALLGFIIFGVYEGTNIAFIKDYSLVVFYLDILWGIILFSTSSLFGRWISNV